MPAPFKNGVPEFAPVWTYLIEGNGPSSALNAQQVLEAVQVYPNPTYNFINIEANTDISKVELFNTQGILVKTATSMQIPMHDLSSGLYLIKINFNEQNVKILKVFKAE